MDIHDCRGCLACQHSRSDAPNPCVISDDMTKIYQAFDESDVIVFASPIYWWTMTGTLKTAIDRLFALQMSRGLDNTKRDSVLIMTAGGRDFSNPASWYENLNSLLGWRDLGTILGAGKEEEARKLGESIA